MIKNFKSFLLGRSTENVKLKHLRAIILGRILTNKTLHHNYLAFYVSNEATKFEIKKAVESQLECNVKSIRIINYSHRKLKCRGIPRGVRKAYVSTL